MKRTFDIVIAGTGLLVLAPLFVLLAVAVKVESRGPVLFRQERIGRYFRPFHILKFRSMVHDAPTKGGLLTAGGDPRITRVGRVLRQTKLDELPQLLNVVLGDMSLVGPRPEVRKYVELFRREYETVLQVRPGITDWASLKYRDESALLGRAADPEAEYVQRILPDKLRLAEAYVQRQSLRLDMSILLHTCAKVLPGRHSHSVQPEEFPLTGPVREGASD